MAVLIGMVGITAFGLGRASVGPQGAEYSSVVPVEETVKESAHVSREIEELATDEYQGEGVPGTYVASKNGARYHLPWCPGAGQMNEENKIWFDTKTKAEKAGYTPAANCEGL